jgi:hypothetical protein
MYINLLLLAMGLLAVAGCASNVTVPPLGLDHPANPQAASAPPLQLLTLNANPASPQGRGIGGMDHSSMSDMNMGEMGHSQSMKRMQDMEGMQGMNHGCMQEMHGMDPSSMKGMKGMKGHSAPKEEPSR